MKRRELIRLGAASALVVPGAGCATLWDLLGNFIKAPKLTIRKMDITKMNLTSVSVKFLADLTNPNPIGFKLFGLDYLMRLAGQELAKGRMPQGINLNPHTSSKTELDLDFDLGRTAEAMLELLNKRVVDYELQAVGKFLSKDNGVDVPVGFKGSMPMPILPKLNVRSFEPSGVSASGVGFRVTTQVHNDNGFEIPIDGLGFGVKLDGRNVLTNKVVRGLRLAPKHTGDVPVDFRVGLAELGVSLLELAGGKRMNWELSSQVRSGKLVVPFTHKGVVRLSA